MKRQLTKHQRAIKRVARHTAYGHQKTKGDWQIEMRAFLDDIGRRQIDGDAFRWQRQPDGGQRAARTRSRDSATALSASPTMAIAGRPFAR